MNPMDHVAELITEGLNPGTPKTAGPLTLVPLFGGAPAKEYLLAAEAFEAGTLTIGELDGGDVPQLVATNTSDLPVLLLDGEHLQGAMQNRVLNASALIDAHTKITLPVACVEQGRWHYEGSQQFSVSPDIAYSGLRAAKAASHAENVRGGRGRQVDQGMVWERVGEMHGHFDLSSETGAMSDAYDAHRRPLNELIGSFEPEPGQTGVIACVEGAPIVLDSFDRPETLTKLWPRLMSGYALDALTRRPVELAPDAVPTFLAAAGSSARTEHAGIGIGTDVIVTGDGVVGNALVWETGIAHLALFANNERRGGVDLGPIATPRQRRLLR